MDNLRRFSAQNNPGEHILLEGNGSRRVTALEAVMCVCEQLRQCKERNFSDKSLLCLPPHYEPPNDVLYLSCDNYFHTGPDSVVGNYVGREYGFPSDRIYIEFSWLEVAELLFFWFHRARWELRASGIDSYEYFFRFSPSNSFSNAIDLKLVFLEDLENRDITVRASAVPSCYIYHLPVSFNEDNENESQVDESEIFNFIDNLTLAMEYESKFPELAKDQLNVFYSSMRKICKDFTEAEFLENFQEIQQLMDDALKKIEELIKSDPKSKPKPKPAPVHVSDLEKCGKVVAKHVAEVGAKRMASKGAQLAMKQVAKQAAKQASKVGTKAVVGAANPIGILGDIAQIGLESSGHKEAGKAVGAGANIGGAALVGAVVGGPVGAVAGAAVGGVAWGVGELIGSLF